MAGVLDRYRRIVVDDTPVVTGLLPVGDSWACTNPTAGRGISLGLAHAVALRDAVRTGADPAALVEEFDRTTEATLTPWYRQQVERDRLRAADLAAVLAGELPETASPDPARQMQAAFFAAAAVDPEVSRAALEVMCCLTLPHEVMGRPGMFDKVAPFAGVTPSGPSGPTREELVALASS
jgi:flavin-dependent dehydrogenase